MRLWQAYHQTCYSTFRRHLMGLVLPFGHGAVAHFGRHGHPLAHTHLFMLSWNDCVSNDMQDGEDVG